MHRLWWIGELARQFSRKDAHPIWFLQKPVIITYHHYFRWNLRIPSPKAILTRLFDLRLV